jgi:pantoate--beta-alanine ligase
MKVIETIVGLWEARRACAGTVGFVPTMGYLHEGHLELARRARRECGTVIVSIFVNPTQFGPKEDFKTYPRDTDRDLALLEPLTDLVFMPSLEEMYPAGSGTWVDVAGLTDVLEGASRPGHFRGVATVVTKLFNIVQPDRAYFGEKDAQQLRVIMKMVRDLDMPVEIVPCPTVREPDGLAMSSRNTRLTPEQRRAAPVLYRSLMMAGEMWSTGEHDVATIRQAMTKLIETEPLAQIDYISLADPDTLEELEGAHPRALVSMAVRFGATRLIDNRLLT